MKKSFLAVALALLLTLLLAGMALAAPATSVYVNGVELSGSSDYWKNGDTGGATGSSSDWNAKWDGTAGTLTLKDAEIDKTADDSGDAVGGIYCTSGDLTLVLQRSNTIDLAGDAIGVYNGKLTIEGPGSLEITAAITGNFGDGVFVRNGDLVIDGAELEINAGYGGIHINGGDLFAEDAELEIQAGMDGICSDYDNVTITGCLLDIEAEENGIYSYWALLLEDCEIRSIRSSGNDGLDGEGITIRDCTAEEIVSTDESYGYAGILAYGYLDIEDSALDLVSGYAYGINCSKSSSPLTGMITFENSRVKVEVDAEDGCAVFSAYTDDEDDEGIVLIDTEVLVGGEIVPAYDGTLFGWTFSHEDSVTVDNYLFEDASLEVVLVTEDDEEFLDEQFLIVGLAILGAGKSFPFIDVPANHWAYQSIFDAYKQGLVNGKEGALYAPDGNLTYAEAIKLAACIHQLQTGGSVTTEVGVGSPWYAPYVEYAELNGIIDKGQFAGKYKSPISRYDFAYIFARAMPDGYYTPLHRISGIPDVPSSSTYLPYVLKLFKAGILNGVDAAGNFQGASPIKRSEVAAIVMRMVDAEQRL